jgi:hypothetical protein
LIPSIRNIDKLIPDFQRLPVVVLIRRTLALRTRKTTRQARKSTHKIIKVRTPLPPNK